MIELLQQVAAGLGVALLFTLAIFIHEFGHYLAARWLGLKVDAFAIGFGPALWRKVVGGIEYKVCCIPFGGYVALPQLDPSGMEKVQGDNSKEGSEPERELPDVPPWKRIVVAFAGPLGNVVLAVGLAYLIFGLPAARTGTLSTRVGWVEEASAAWASGLRPGDEIVAVNGKSVANWTDLQVENQLAGEAGKARFAVRRGGEPAELMLAFQTNNVLGLRLLEGVYPARSCVVEEVTDGSPAEAAGLRPKDVIERLDDEPVMGAEHFIRLMQKQTGAAAALAVRRGKERLSLTVTPKFDEARKRFLIGIVPENGLDQVKPWMMYPDPWQQLKWDSMSVVRVLQALVNPVNKGERRAVAKNVGGPIAIVMGLYDTLRGSLIDALGFLRMICVNLAILNLLPVPVLDGGHIVFALYEVVTRRKPHPKVVAVLVNAFAILLISLMALLVYSDIAKRVKLNKALRELKQEAEEALEAGARPAAVTNAPAPAAAAQP
jgi:regulator of sigma E protease